MTKCEYCDSPLDYEVTECSHCGAPCELIQRPSDLVQAHERIIEMQKSEQLQKQQLAKQNNKELIEMSNVDVSFLKKNRNQDVKVSMMSVIGIVVIVVIVIVCIVSCA